jgi:DNA-binding MarR family transcriptional regulator
MAVLRAEDCGASRAPGRLLRRLDKIVSALVEARFRAKFPSNFGGTDLTLMQWVALKVVLDGVVGSAGELAQELGVTTGATTRLIDGLEERGLMLRDRTCTDRRVVQVTVTPAGREAVRALQTQVVATWNELLAGFSEKEADSLVALLLKLLAAAEQAAERDALEHPAKDAPRHEESGS